MPRSAKNDDRFPLAPSFLHVGEVLCRPLVPRFGELALPIGEDRAAGDYPAISLEIAFELGRHLLKKRRGANGQNLLRLLRGVVAILEADF